MKNKTSRIKNTSIYVLFSILKSSPELRVDLSLYFGALFSGMYAVVNFFALVSYANIWSLTVSLYYVGLMLLRLLLLVNRDKSYELSSESEFLCELEVRVGIYLLLLNLLLGAMTVYSTETLLGKNIGAFYVFGYAIYTAFLLVSSLLGAFKARKIRHPTALSGRIVNLCAALLSLYNLVYSIILWGDFNNYLSEIINRALAVAVVTAVNFLAVFLISRGKKGKRGSRKPR